MKIKTSYLVYAVIATVFAGLSMFTDIFEKGNFEAIFSNLGMIIGLSISAYILITMAKSFIDLVINDLKNQEAQNETIENTLIQKSGIVWLSARNSNDEGHSMLIDALRFVFTTGACGTCIDATKYVKRYFHINYGWGESYNGYYLYIPQSDNYDQDLRWEGTSRTFPYQMKAFSVWQTKNE